MKVYEAIEKIKQRKPNAYNEEALNDWLNECEAIVQRELFLTPPEEIVQYAWPEDRDEELILPKPYDALYVTYVKMMIEFTQEEFGTYNNTNKMYLAQYQAAQGYYNKLDPNPPSLRIKNWMRG